MKENKNAKPVSGLVNESVNGFTKLNPNELQVKSLTGLSALRPPNSNANNNKQNSQTSTGNNQSKNTSGN